MNNPSLVSSEKPEGAAAPPDQTWEDFEQSLLQFNEKHLWSMLLCIQERLGTSAEQPDDLDRVQAIAHRLSNVLATIRMKTDLALMKREKDLAGPDGLIG